jgi:hypothetical protein
MIRQTLIAILILFSITVSAQKSSSNQSEKWWKETRFLSDLYAIFSG